jgi:hypothetical protein
LRARSERRERRRGLDRPGFARVKPRKKPSRNQRHIAW